MPNRLKFSSRLIAVASIPLISSAASATQLPVGEIRKQLANGENNQVAVNVAPETGNVSRNLSADTIDLATKWNLLPRLIALEEMRQTAVSDSQIVRLTAMKQDLVYELMDYEYDIRVAVNKIEIELDKANDKYALLAEKRDRAIRLNTYANLVSGGLTGILSGSLSLGRVNPIAPDTIDTVEGVIQTSLSAWGLHELHGEHKIERGVPNILSNFVNSTQMHRVFPDSVSVYLNSVPSDSLTGDTRKTDLVSHWVERGFGAVAFKHKTNQQERMSKAAGIHAGPHRLTVHVLEDRIAMLTDLQTAVAQMETNLQEILQFVRGTRNLAQNTR